MTVTDTRRVIIPTLGFGDRLRRVRLDLDMKQAEFADAIGMNQGAYSRHELSASNPRNARMIANCVELRFDVPAWWILGYDDENGCAARDSNPEPADYVPSLVILSAA